MSAVRLRPVHASATVTNGASLPHVDAHNAEALALLERAVNINSGTQNFAGVRAVGKLFGAEFEALGFKTRWVDGAPFKRAGHLVAERPRPGRRFLLIGHLDTVFEPDSPFQKFERLERTARARAGRHRHEGRRRHHVQALKALKAAGALEAHERHGRDDRRRRVVRRSAGRRAGGARRCREGRDVAHRLRGRRRRSAERAVIGRRGTTAWTLTVTGKPAHSSQIFRQDIGYGAMFEAARILNAFRETLGRASRT